MSATTVPRARRRVRGLGGSLAVLALAVLSGGALAGCSSSSAGMSPATGGGAAAAEMQGMSAAASVAWQDRPAYVFTASASTQEAYRFALERPSVVDGMPCYCGCVEMDHRSNLDCFLKPRATGGPIAFEQHASFCDICVQIALRAKQLSSQGRTLSQVRQAIDQEFGGRGPGTRTALPPA